MSYHLTQAFTGHGCFGAYLNKIGKTDSPGCWFCDSPLDDAEHTVFQCDAWHHSRIRLQHQIGQSPNPETILAAMLKSEENWTAVREYVKNIMHQKKDEERRRRQNAA